MSQEDKDVVLFVTKEEEQELGFDEEVEQAPLAADLGEAVGPNGDINWDCPCLGGMTEGPCGELFKEAFSCFVYSQAEDKGSDCVEQFQAMHECLRENMDFYDTSAGDDEEVEPDVAVETEATPGETSAEATETSETANDTQQK
eukprot:m.36565 g.36565  ORF g.36565 m.36565 type:complete len:144 (-) comp10025_c0_seq1:251-682(-)